LAKDKILRLPAMVKIENWTQCLLLKMKQQQPCLFARQYSVPVAKPEDVLQAENLLSRETYS